MNQRINTVSENLDNKATTTGDSKLDALKQENINKLKTVPTGTLDTNKLAQSIDSKSTIIEQQNIQKFLQIVESSPLPKDFSTELKAGRGNSFDEFLKNPSILSLAKSEALSKKQKTRIDNWNKVIKPVFNGETSLDLAKWIGDFYQTKIISETCKPGKDIFKLIEKPGTINIRWTQAETQKNLNWKNTENPLAFIDWLDKNMKNISKERDKEIGNWASNNVKKAEKNPQLFSSKYVEQLKKIEQSLKSGNNNYPIELLRDFEKIAVPERQGKRQEKEKEIAAEMDKNAKILGPKNVGKWKKGWLKNASADELLDWHNTDKPGEKAEFQKLVDRRKILEDRFLKELNNYPAANKKEYADWFYTLFDDIDGEGKNEQEVLDYAFSYLEGKKNSILEASKEAGDLLLNKKDFLEDHETDALKNIANLSRTEQEQLVKETQAEVQKREHTFNQFKSRKQVFEKCFEAIQDGTSKEKLEQIVKPITDIKAKLEDFNCSGVLDAVNTCEELENKVQEEQESPSEELDFLKLFEQDHTLFAILQAEIINEQNKESGTDKKAEQEEITAAIKEKKSAPIAKESGAKEVAELSNAERAQVLLDTTNTEANLTNFPQEELKSQTFQEAYREEKDKEAINILSTNDSISSQAKNIQNSININLDNSALNFTKDTGKNIHRVLQQTSTNNIILTDQTNKKLEDKTKKKNKFTELATKGFNKFFGEKEAKKASVNSQNMWEGLKDARSAMSAGDSYEEAQKKLAEKLNKRNAVNNPNYKGKGKKAA